MPCALSGARCRTGRTCARVRGPCTVRQLDDGDSITFTCSDVMGERGLWQPVPDFQVLDWPGTAPLAGNGTAGQMEEKSNFENT